MGLQNLKNYKSSKNVNQSKGKDAQNNDDEDQEDNNGEPDRNQAIETAQGDDKKNASDTGITTSKGKIQNSKGQKDDKKNKNHHASSTDALYPGHDAMSSYYMHPMYMP